MAGIANRSSWIDGGPVIAMTSLGPSIRSEPDSPASEHFSSHNPRPATYSRTSSVNALPAVPSSVSVNRAIVPKAVIQEPRSDESTPQKLPAPRAIHGWKWAIAVVAILSSVFLFSLDQTIVADVQPDIVNHFGAVAKLPWLSVSLLLGAASTNLFWGKLYSQFNPKWLYIFTVALFETGSAVCGAAPSMNALIVGRVLAGLGGAGMYLGVLMLLSFFTSPVERPQYIGMIGAVFGLGTVLGPVIGGAFADSAATWRWAFYINLCIGGIFAPVYFFMLPGKDPQPGKSFVARMAEVDWVGNTLIIGAFVSGIMGISFGGTVYPWGSGQTVGLFCTSGFLLIILGMQQGALIWTTEKRRMFPVHYIWVKEMVILFAETAAAGTSSFVTIYFVPLYFQFVRHDSALTAGVRLMPYIVPLVVFTLLNGLLMGKLGYYMPWFLIGGILMLISNVMLYRITLSTNAGYIFGAEVLGGIGTGMFVNAPFSVSQWIVTPMEISAAVSFIMFARVGGIALALAMANAIFLNLAENAISHIVPTASKLEVQGAISGVASSLIDNADAATRVRVSQAIVDALRMGFTLGIAAGVLSIALAVFMNREKIVLMPPPGASARDKGGAKA